LVRAGLRPRGGLAGGFALRLRAGLPSLPAVGSTTSSRFWSRIRTLRGFGSSVSAKSEACRPSSVVVSSRM